jgi:hypothetical protein
MFGKKEKKAEVPLGDTGIPVVNLSQMMQQKPPEPVEKPEKDLKEILSDIAKRKGFIDESTGYYWVCLNDVFDAI